MDGKTFRTQLIVSTIPKSLFLQEAQSGIPPTDIQVWVAGHKGSDSSNPDQLCTSTATERLV